MSRIQYKLSAIVAASAFATGCSGGGEELRFGEWQWDITISRDGQDFLDQSTDCMTKSEAEDGFEVIVTGFASNYQCFTKTVEVENDKGVVTIDNCVDNYVNGTFTLKRRSAKRFTVDGIFNYRDSGRVELRNISVNAKHISDTCKLKLD